MKRNFNKKKLLTFSLLSIFALALVSAILVSYFSSVSTVVTVNSPIEFGLYNTASQPILDGTADMKAGEVFEFFKIAKNNADVGIEFAIVTIVQGTKDGIYVDSAGPKGDKNTIGQAVVDGNGVWDSLDDWYQIEGESWYLHGAHDSDLVSDYAYLDDDVLTDAGYTTTNDKYNDAEGFTYSVDGKDYYVVVFGGTIGDNSADVNTPILESDVITNWGYGGADSYVKRTADEPLVMPTGAYDIGKVRVYFNQDLEPGIYTVKTAVVTPGKSIGTIINELFSVA